MNKCLCCKLCEPKEGSDFCDDECQKEYYELVIKPQSEEFKTPLGTKDRRKQIRVMVSKEMHLEMFINHPEVNWAEFCRQAIKYYLKQNYKSINQQFKGFEPNTLNQKRGKLID